MTIERGDKLKDTHLGKVYTVDEVIDTPRLIFVLVSPEGDESRWDDYQLREHFVKVKTSEVE